MAKRKDLVVEQLNQLADDLEELWKALTRDPAAERRKERAWTLLVGGLTAVSAMGARRALAKLWPILTGERLPSPKGPATQQRSRPVEQDTVSTGR